jgi:DNA-binding XRE family transcriptional regulator
MSQSGLRADRSKIKAARKAKGWSQQELARRAGNALSVIQKLEQGSYFSLTCLGQCAEALGLSTVDLMVTGVLAEDALTEEKLLGCFTAAYVLDAVGLLYPPTKAKLDSLRYPGCLAWDATVEEGYGITRPFVRGVYKLCSEFKDPIDSVQFILRGLGCPGYVDRLRELFGQAAND